MPSRGTAASLPRHAARRRASLPSGRTAGRRNRPWAADKSCNRCPARSGRRERPPETFARPDFPERQAAAPAPTARATLWVAALVEPPGSWGAEACCRGRPLSLVRSYPCTKRSKSPSRRALSRRRPIVPISTFGSIASRRWQPDRDRWRTSCFGDPRVAPCSGRDAGSRARRAISGEANSTKDLTKRAPLRATRRSEPQKPPTRAAHRAGRKWSDSTGVIAGAVLVLGDLFEDLAVVTRGLATQATDGGEPRRARDPLVPGNGGQRLHRELLSVVCPAGIGLEHRHVEHRHMTTRGRLRELACAFVFLEALVAFGKAGVRLPSHKARTGFSNQERRVQVVRSKRRRLRPHKLASGLWIARGRAVHRSTRFRVVCHLPLSEDQGTRPRPRFRSECSGEHRGSAWAR